MKLFFQSKRWAKLFISDDAPNKDGARYSQFTLFKTSKKLLNFLLTFTFIVTFTACNDDGIIVIDDYIVKDTTNYPLVGTRWYLVAFVDVENNITTYPDRSDYPEEYLHPDSLKKTSDYFLHFFNDTQCRGIRYCRYVGINYNIDSSVSVCWKFNNFEVKYYNECGEMGEPLLYAAALEKVQSYTYTKKTTPHQLKLFYDDEKKYLLFEPSEFKFIFEEDDDD